MHDLLDRLVRLQEKQESHHKRREEQDMDVKLKVTPTLVNITAKNAEVLIEELDRFETQMSMQGVKTWKQLYRLFTTAITDDKVLK